MDNLPIILCVDDEAIILDSLKQTLYDKFQDEVVIETAQSAKEALEFINFLQGRDEQLTLIISDYLMPDMKGDALLKEVQAVSPNTVKILLTGQADTEAIIRTINEANLFRYIEKPWDSTDLLLSVRSALESYAQDEQIAIQEQIIALSKKNVSLELRLEQRTLEVKEKNDKIEAATRYAARIQRALLASEQRIKQSIKDIFVIYEPNYLISGCFYWFEHTPDDKRILIAGEVHLGDIPGAFVATKLIMLLNRIVRERKITTPLEILQQLRSDFATIWRQQQNFTDNIIVEVAVCCICPKMQMIQIVNTGLPVLLFKNKIVSDLDDYQKTIKNSSKASSKSDLAYYEVPMQEELRIYLYSKSCIEFYEKKKPKMADSFYTAFDQLQTIDFKKQKQSILHFFENLKNKKTHAEDIMFIGVEPKCMQEPTNEDIKALPI
ncbi:MAG: response regulator [Bernardetiaceae bacterium]|nr:response regulator [Bernardetiaceae bacterium]